MQPKNMKYLLRKKNVTLTVFGSSNTAKKMLHYQLNLSIHDSEYKNVLNWFPLLIHYLKYMQQYVGICNAFNRWCRLKPPVIAHCASFDMSVSRKNMDEG